MNWLKKDKTFLGILLGLLIPVPVAMVLAVILRLLQINFRLLGGTRITDMFLLGLALNLIVMRYYILKLKFEKTGKGLLITTVILMLLFFLFMKNSNLNPIF